MRESIMSPSTHPGSVGKFRHEQLRGRLDWGIVPDDQIQMAALHVIHITPENGSTVAYVNPTDPATVADTAQGYLEPPGDYGRVMRAGRLA